MVDRYIGVENEFTSFKDGRQEPFSGYLMRAFIREEDYEKTRTAVRTRTGHAYYVDGTELELVTPPVAVNKGFSTRLTDLLLIGRERIARTELGLEHTGYSMHWNVSMEIGYDKMDFWEGLIVPFHLFGLTPVSKGLRVNLRDNLLAPRYEVFGDHISNENQLNATALLLGAYAHAIGQGKAPLKPIGRRPDKRFKTNAFLGRRESLVLTSIPHIQFENDISAQQYLELFYKWIEPFVKELGSKREISNLEEFVDGSQRLEFDLKGYYNDIKTHYGVYAPHPAYNDQYPGPLLRATGEERELPLEGKLLGAIVELKRPINEFSWGYLDTGKKTVVGTKPLFEYASKLEENLPSFIPPLDVGNVKPNDIEEYVKEMGLESISKGSSLDNPRTPSERDIQYGVEYVGGMELDSRRVVSVRTLEEPIVSQESFETPDMRTVNEYAADELIRIGTGVDPYQERMRRREQRNTEEHPEAKIFDIWF